MNALRLFRLSPLPETASDLFREPGAEVEIVAVIGLTSAGGLEMLKDGETVYGHTSDMKHMDTLTAENIEVARQRLHRRLAALERWSQAQKAMLAQIDDLEIGLQDAIEEGSHGQ